MAQRTVSAVYVLAAVAGLWAAPEPAAGERLRELCVDRPGKDTPPCIVDAGHLLVELGAVEFSRDTAPEVAVTSYAVGDVLARYGLTGRSEIQLGFTPYTIVRTKDRTNDRRETLQGAGDLTGAFKFSLLNPDGSGTSIAVQAFVTAPTGRQGIGSNAWEGGVIVPVAFELSDTWSLTLDPEIDWRADEDGQGHHLAWAGVVSLSRDLGGGLEGSAELWSSYDREPENHTTEASFDLALTWVPKSRPNLQFDAEVDLGLTDSTPDIEAAVGVAYRF